MNPLDQFFTAVANAAQRLGIQSVAVAARDPRSGEARFVFTEKAKTELRDPIASQWGFAEVSDTSWGDHGG